ncbi:MAG: hypothetical protein ACXW5U_26255 [Thermoanaerobaculia bacterium]
MRSILSALFSLLLVFPAAGQALTIGNDVTPGAPATSGSAPTTAIDLANPATATGTITAVKYHWTTAGCASALKIKFIRRAGQTFTVTEERGPFDSSLVDTIALAPPVPVQQGDLIGITRLTNCGVARSSTVDSDGYLVFTSDVTGTFPYASAYGQSAHSLALYGTGTATESVRGVIAVVGSTRGGFGSNWKTALQLFNPSSMSTLTGRLVFRPQANTTGPFASIDYSLGPGQMKTYDDIVEAMGQSDLGSLDVVVPAGASEPLFASRIYDDAGESGTAGLSQEYIARDVTLKKVARILGRGTTGFLFTPPHPTRTRLNIGLRTLDSGAYFEVTLRNDAGATIRTWTKSYPPNYFLQVDSAAFIGPITGNETIEIHVITGSVIVYGSTTDNITNDPSVQFAVVFFSTG